MNKERDKFLTETMGECWHYYPTYLNEFTLTHTTPCRICRTQVGRFCRPDFSTWAGFGKLWEWAQQQVWWEDFFTSCEAMTKFFRLSDTAEEIIHPNRFANAVYNFLKE